MMRKRAMRCWGNTYLKGLHLSHFEYACCVTVLCVCVCVWRVWLSATNPVKQTSALYHRSISPTNQFPWQDFTLVWDWVVVVAARTLGFPRIHNPRSVRETTLPESRRKNVHRDTVSLYVIIVYKRTKATPVRHDSPGMISPCIHRQIWILGGPEQNVKVNPNLLDPRKS